MLVALAAALGVALGSTGCQLTSDVDSTFRPASASKKTPFAVMACGPVYAQTDGSKSRQEVVQASCGAPVALPELGNAGDSQDASRAAPEAVRTSGPAPPPAADGAPAGFCLGPVPTELCRASLPPYTIAPPDILFIDTVRLVPKPPYRIEPLETLLVKVTETLPGQPIDGAYAVSPEGTINLGYAYGSVRVAGITLDQAQAAIRSHLGNVLRNPQVVVALGQFRGMQQTRGEHLVRPDGTISLGAYGCVYVAGLTLSQAKCEIEKQLGQYFLEPQVAVDMLAYNSKVYYVILDGRGFGMQVFPIAVTGNETVLDAVGKVSSLAPVSSVRRVWVARPAPPGHPCDQVLPVDWLAIVKGGATATNYQLFPGDRVYVDADCVIRCDNCLAKAFATLLGTSTVEQIRFYNHFGTNRGTFVAVP
jgi:protein involved in polysaccharide export with SLBB domain